MNDMTLAIQEILDARDALLNSLNSASLATVTPAGDPLISYVPVAQGKDRIFYLFVSDLTDHTENLKANGQASMMLIADESESPQIFARRRLILEGSATMISRDDTHWPRAEETYAESFAEMFKLLKTLKDFHMFSFRANTAKLVLGFGQAYMLEGANWDEPRQLGGKTKKVD